MSRITHVCLSDLHLGQQDSLLTSTDDVGRPSPVLRRLAECLAEVLRKNDAGAPKPTLVLNGDLLELALCPTQRTLVVFEQFLRVVMPANSELFGDIIYIPGNHDHHSWQAARETQYMKYLASLPPGEPVEPPWDTTKLFMDMAGKDRLVAGVATAVSRRLPNLAGRNFEILTAYPNFGIRKGREHLVFHHGHFIEPAYTFFSTLASLFFPEQKLPEDVYTLERENSAWIDFFWSTLGSCGRMGPDIETIYEASADETRLRKLTDTLAHSIAEKYPVPQWAPRFVREWVLKGVLYQAAGGVATGLERRDAKGDTLLSPEAAKGLRWYLEKPLRQQFERETGAGPESLTFVLGHTHKPCVDIQDGARVLNTGGWVVDTPQPAPLHGAAAVLVGEDLACVNLRLYNEGTYEVRVEEPALPGGKHSALHDEVRMLIDSDPRPWTAFAQTAKAEVELRAAGLAGRLKTFAAAAGAGT